MRVVIEEASHAIYTIYRSGALYIRISAINATLVAYRGRNTSGTFLSNQNYMVAWRLINAEIYNVTAFGSEKERKEKTLYVVVSMTYM